MNYHTFYDYESGRWYGRLHLSKRHPWYKSVKSILTRSCDSFDEAMQEVEKMEKKETLKLKPL